MTTGKTIVLTIQTSVYKVMSLLFNMLSRFVIIYAVWHTIWCTSYYILSRFVYIVQTLIMFYSYVCLPPLSTYASVRSFSFVEKIIVLSYIPYIQSLISWLWWLKSPIFSNDWKVFDHLSCHSAPGVHLWFYPHTCMWSNTQKLVPKAALEVLGLPRSWTLYCQIYT